ncbi:glycosyltransferase [bacterium]|nr:glycosyltransferase [bacterium]
MIKKTQQQVMKDWGCRFQTPLVSVLCLTYNQESFISDAIDGFLMQETSFPFEIIIGEDCSSDNTANIVRQYKIKFPDIISCILRTENIGANSNFANCCQKAKGRYIATCDGDDYWTDPKKLETQVNCLQKNKNISLCFHKVNVTQRLNENYRYKIPNKRILKFNDILFTHYIPTASLMFKMEFLPNEYFSKQIANFSIGDIPLELTLVDRGNACFIPEIMAVYRRHENGITENTEQIKNGRGTYIKVYSYLRKHLHYSHWLSLTLVILKTRLGAIKDLIKI